MSTSRAESQHHYGRRRSNTAQSILRNPPVPPLQIGDVKGFNSWVHDAKDPPTVIFNQSWWPGVAEGDMLQITGGNSEDTSSGFLFVVPKDEGCPKPQLQISIAKPIADAFGLRNNGEVTISKVDKTLFCADYVEFVFQDQYLGRNDMWRMGEALVGQCVYKDQEIKFLGSICAKIQTIYTAGKKVSAACMTSSTKTIFRSLSAKVTIFIQICRELWEFADDGERYNEKIVHSFLPALFGKWREAGTNHTVTIVLISRVYYDQSEIEYAAGPLRRDDDGGWYKDFYKVITDLEVINDWKSTLVGLKTSFWDFQRDILLTHHYHRATLETAAMGPADQVRLVGRLSFAHEGPILEALNLGLNPTETHYIDRSLSLTGAATILITPGTGYFKVSKQLLRLTTTRMLDQGFGLDLVSLAKPPLHQSPILSFQGLEPELRLDRDDRDGKGHARATDPLWGGDDDPKESAGRERSTFWWEPFWMSVSFWDKQMDLPFRDDRFIACAKMHEIQMLGLLEHDVLSSIEIAFLPDQSDPLATPRDGFVPDSNFTQADADKFDSDIFATKNDSKLPATNRNSYGSAGSGTIMPSSYRSGLEKRSIASHRNSIISARIAPIEESPRHILRDLPPEPSHADTMFAASSGLLSTSPSQSSMRSVRSTHSTSTSSSTADRNPRDSSTGRSSKVSKFAPSWLFNPFRSGPSEPQTSSVSASAVTSLVVTTQPIRILPSSPKSTTQSTLAVSPRPMAIKNSTTPRSNLSRTFEEESMMPHRGGLYSRQSPLNTPPRDEAQFAKRRSNTMSSSILTAVPLSTSSSAYRSNPSQPNSSVSYAQFSLARRWQHIFPTPQFKHEIKWQSLVTPGCLPLTVEYFPTSAELESSYDVTSYDFLVEPSEVRRSFFVKPPVIKGTNIHEIRRAWALAVMREMVAVRLAQGFQFVLRPHKATEFEDRSQPRRTQSFLMDDDLTPKPAGAAEVLQTADDPVYLSMSNEIHCISYIGEAIQVRRFTRRMPPSSPFSYQCLIWPKLGVGYTELETKFTSHGLENYGWNRLDMLVAGFEHQFSESLRYWRTRFIVMPTAEAPQTKLGPSGEMLNAEEIRLMGIDKLADMFSKLRWQFPEEKTNPPPPVRFLPTTLLPASSVLDSSLMAQLDELHAAGPLRKKMKSEREIGDTSLLAIAKAMREEDAVPIKHYQWHHLHYPDAFTGFDFVSWLVREFRDVSSREQGAEWGVKLQEQGLFEHCKGNHGFLDGHYFYRLKGEYAVPSTPRGWFRSRHAVGDENLTRGGHYPSNVGKISASSPRKNRKQLILSQTMVIDIDPAKKSDQAEPVILHHDIIHNPATVFHFELQWIGTTASFIDERLKTWSRTIERYGLKLVEAYVTQISDIRERNAFQSCFPIRLAVPAPFVMNIEKRVPEGTQTAHYFEYALLRRFGFILDVEAAALYPQQVDFVYSYRRSPYAHSQFVHRTGVAFVQVLGGSRGFLFLTNRLMGPGRMGAAMNSKGGRPAAVAAEDIRVQLNAFCTDRKRLLDFYDEELAMLEHGPEEPPPLSI
ncbi:hypothetical protein PLICRDRAFT_41333 [Plicaturopsis crispa FD-325 SS-3]|nr:hypothetical protein PLICRDRAFT_41333 [Plicaturopsis crispa FD-325 SS-3]